MNGTSIVFKARRACNALGEECQAKLYLSSVGFKIVGAEVRRRSKRRKIDFPDRRKRRSTAALQDAGALVTGARRSARFWGAPPLRRFGFATRFKVPTQAQKARGGFP